MGDLRLGFAIRGGAVPTGSARLVGAVSCWQCVKTSYQVAEAAGVFAQLWYFAQLLGKRRNHPKRDFKHSDITAQTLVTMLRSRHFLQFAKEAPCERGRLQ